MSVPPKNETKTQYSCRYWAFLRTKIDFKNEKLTTKLRRNKAEKPYFKKKHIPKDLEIIQIFFSQVLTDTDSSSI